MYVIKFETDLGVYETKLQLEWLLWHTIQFAHKQHAIIECCLYEKV
jgi:hypothetical protein